MRGAVAPPAKPSRFSDGRAQTFLPPRARVERHHAERREGSARRLTLRPPMSAARIRVEAQPAAEPFRLLASWLATERQEEYGRHRGGAGQPVSRGSTATRTPQRVSHVRSLPACCKGFRKSADM